MLACAFINELHSFATHVKNIEGRKRTAIFCDLISQSFSENSIYIRLEEKMTTKEEKKSVNDYDFTTGDAGASHVFNSEAGQVRVGG